MYVPLYFIIYMNNTEYIKENKSIANKLIPEMSVNTSLTNLIYLKGKLNKINLKIMIDSGSSSCVIFKSIVNKCNLNYLIDTSISSIVQYANDMNQTLGKIWCVELELDIDNNKSIYVPISIDVINDNNNKSQTYIDINEFDIILGINFLKLYKANIDFDTNILTLDKNIKIKF